LPSGFSHAPTRPHARRAESAFLPAEGEPHILFVPTQTTIGPEDLQAAIAQMAETIAARHPTPSQLLILGIANGGITLAQRLAAKLGAHRVGIIDVSFHRDDIGLKPIPKEFTPTIIPGNLQGATVLLVDDVLFSGRTVNAALNELFDHGRPACVELAVLADRGGRTLPIQADYVGLHLSAGTRERVVLALSREPSAQDSLTIKAANLPAS